ncbi:hypothetical protein HU200_063808 [Digitaria exilis]|uniref:Uncharacterized protein n=1 Tax=Digitaria exilis TaxID=1010633 RepID=A0A835DW69_9POAL|nr:hypothetical protein HU200_063808 [Digitaria exilis]
MILQALQDFGSSIFRQVVMLAYWVIWCHRHSIIFDNGTTSFEVWRAFFEELKLVTLGVKPVVKDKIITLFCIVCNICLFSFWELI